MIELQKFVENKLSDVSKYEFVSGVIGGEKPSAYSKSPLMWNAAFKKFGIPAVYFPFDVTENNFDSFISGAKRLNAIRGFNITVPFKNKIIPHLDFVHPHAREYEAVNSVVKRNNNYSGYNTDGKGGAQNLKEKVGKLDGKKILQIGAGGAGNAISYILVEEGASLILANRTPERAVDLARRLKNFYTLSRPIIAGGEDLIPLHAKEVDIILNVSLKGQRGSPLEKYSALTATTESNLEDSLKLAEQIPRHVLFADVIYSPEETPYLKHGRETRHQTLNGLGMLLHQAVFAFELIFEKEVKEDEISHDSIVEVMRSALASS